MPGIEGGRVRLQVQRPWPVERSDYRESREAPQAIGIIA